MAKHEMSGAFKIARPKTFFKGVRGVELNAPSVKHRVLVTTRVDSGEYTVTCFRDHGLAAPHLDSEKEVLKGSYEEVAGFVKEFCGVELPEAGVIAPTRVDPLELSEV